MRVLMIDNYDSFTYNLVHYIGELGAEVDVVRNDKITLDEIAEKAPDAIVISPGPCTPNEAGICLPLISRFAGEIPLFGVCLGLQSMGQAFGGEVVRAPRPMHGKVSTITHDGRGVFRGLNKQFEATRYHSLVVRDETLPGELTVTARSDDGQIMGLQHRVLPVHGVQFHPESISSENGHAILQNFLNIARDFNADRAA
ncbi:aminodeoxychorismate/anthranilate synthase component II [Pelagibacterium flavum]|uniref:Aminodeoxychorismate/anthranilate synthase component II n=1 Tax=Pelagibacterium flavum TaxID=2984530 RepID=A0ABY6IJ08_9HYPH|nr:aminodeoxychorismate/anthranilate synthase component II [Pelagibacterium sp. YIM 151497]MAN76573.1 aminodeoxychorismate/anthranilate synthase component II [Hyphomicrobiales bacterium]UYQ70585.1 aminodeoxychorismate/anthranilate synthase component II [Pelagibacterium sp. YIM 151497]|tara:strand:+ start:3438 stop:4034 length:597 start_codon:yes stop_codon:yes gene_type:complete